MTYAAPSFPPPALWHVSIFSKMRPRCLQKALQRRGGGSKMSKR